MPPLSAQDVLTIWETASGQDPVRRALTILAVAARSQSGDAVAALTVGRRDARLLAVLEDTFGPKLDSVASCARCGEPVEFVLAADELRAKLCAAADDDRGDVSVGDWSLRYRLPTSEDLLAAAASRDPDDARRVLGARCMVEARHAGSPAALPDVPAEVADRMAEAMGERDPLADVLIDFSCPACGQRGETIFDVTAYLWEIIRLQAVRLLREVDALARAYGWREVDILALSAVRRHAYLDLAT
jgi:hypothetical protein